MEEATEKTASGSFMEAFGGKPSGPITADQINAELDEAIARSSKRKLTDRDFLEWLRCAQPDLYARWLAGPRLQDHGAEEVVTIYGALRTYLKILTQQPDEDLETIARVTRLMIAIKPQAVEASQEITNRNTSS